MTFAIAVGCKVSLDAMWRSLCTAMWHSYAGAGYTNPHAVTSIGDGLSTTTYAYDNNFSYWLFAKMSRPLISGVLYKFLGAVLILGEVLHLLIGRD